MILTKVQMEFCILLKLFNLQFGKLKINNWYIPYSFLILGLYVEIATRTQYNRASSYWSVGQRNIKYQ
jgi:hypothetical protein